MKFKFLPLLITAIFCFHFNAKSQCDIPLPFEGNTYLIEIESKEEISFNEFENNLLFSYEKLDSKEFIYKLKFKTLNEVDNLKSYLLSCNQIISIKKNIL